MRVKTGQDQKGFTLLEVIVVLMISSLVAVILMQGLSLTLNARLRVADVVEDLDKKGVQVSVLTTPLRGVLPDYQDGQDVFFGDQKRIRGLTLSPLQGTFGAPTGFGMIMEYDIGDDATVLTYFERGYDPVEIARWKGDVGGFSFRGRTGDWAPAWPPRRDDAKQAPRTIQFSTGLQETAFVIRVMGPHDRVGRLQDGPFGNAQ